ncbi:unnamed protein product [Bemisia tabaci]|uniref:Uncharacterized protein n=1 Tax=Bemisia tabaci TaxID=7038 RepID=A0A9P0F7I1_BEMTA|nr:unnamed protein product [Bemisia tabaci]
MLTAFVVQTTIMSAAFGIINYNPHVIDSLHPEIPSGLLDALVEHIYTDTLTPSLANNTEMLQPKSEEVSMKPSMEFLGDDTQHMSQNETAEEKNPPLMAFRKDTLASINSNSNEKENFTLVRSEKFKPLKQRVGKEVPKQNSNKTLGNNESKISMGGSGEASGKFSRNTLHESWSEKFQGGFGNFGKSSFKYPGMNPLSNVKEKQKKDLVEGLEDMEREILELKILNKAKKFEKEGGNGVTQQSFKGLSQLGQALQILAQLMQSSWYFSKSKSAMTNATDDTSKLKAKNDEPALILQESVNLDEFPNSSKTISRFDVDSSDNGNWFEHLFKSLLFFKENSSNPEKDDSENSVITNKKMEEFQNYLLYHKIPHFVNAFWNQGVSTPNSTNQSSKLTQDHLDYLHSNSSHQPSESIVKRQTELIKKENPERGNKIRTIIVAFSKFEKSNSPPLITSWIVNDTDARWKSTKISLGSNVEDNGHRDSQNLLHTRWLKQQNKTKSSKNITEIPKQDEITCIIPRQNTSTFYCDFPMLVSTRPKSNFGKFFNKKNKRRKMKSCKSTTHLCSCKTTTHLQVCKSTTTVPCTIPNLGNSSSLHDVPSQLLITDIPTTRYEIEHRTNHEQSENKRLYDEQIDNILKDISTNMCLPNMINKLVELVNQSRTNSSQTAHHMVTNESNSEDYVCDHNKMNSNNFTGSATRLKNNESMKQKVKESRSVVRDKNSRLQFLKHDYYDKHSHPSIPQRSLLEDDKNRDLSNLIFLIGIKRAKERGENAKLQKRYFDMAYIRSQV